MKKKTFVIGDIHGGLKALKDLLEKLQLQSKDELIFLGDYVDGWSESAETVFFLIELAKTHTCIFIKGNHDELCYDWLLTGEHTEEWGIHGGLATKQSYARYTKTELATQLDFFENLQNYVIIEKNKLFLHAGFTNLKGPCAEYFDKTYYWDRTLWELALSVNPQLSKGDILYPKRLSLFDEVYIGHTPTTRIGKTVPMNAACIWNVDTGAAFKGPLSAINIETKEVFQSAPVYTYYPEESGRN